MRGPKVFIVTPAFNAERHIARFLQSTKDQSYTNLEVIIIDDGSTDNTSKLIKQLDAKTIVIKGDGDLWWSGSTNLGVDYALKHKADYIITVNVDVELDKDCVESLVKSAEENPRALIGSIVCDVQNRDKVWYFGGYWDKKRGDLKHATGSIKDIDKAFFKPDWLTGMGTIIPAGAFTKVGMYDANTFPHYFGDADFSIRAQRAGYSLLVTSKSFVYADLSSSWLEKWLARPRLNFFWNLFTSTRSQYNIKKRFIFYRKYWGEGYAKALFRLYFISLSELYRLWAVLYIKRLIGRA